jgi:hypothetical protein
MLRKILLSSRSPKGTYTLQGAYYDKVSRKHLYCVENGKRIISDFEQDGSFKQFDVLLNDGAIYTLEYEDSNPYELAVVDFYMNHPLVLSEGHDNPNLINALFTLVLQHKIIDNEVAKLGENFDTALKCMSLSFEEKYDLAFALGIDARSLSHKELISRLVGPNLTGEAIVRKNVFDYFYNAVDSDKKVKVYANKAITLGLIKYESGFYRVGGRTLGPTERDVVDMCNSDKDLFYGFIVPEVDKAVTQPAKNLDDMTKSDITEVVAEKIKEVKKTREKKTALVDGLTV